MSNPKKIIALSLLITLFTSLSFDVLAAQAKLPSDLGEMTTLERIQWLETNSSQTLEYGTRIGTQRNIVTEYTKTKLATSKNEIGNKTVGITVTYHWLRNLDDTIESYNISDFSTIIYDSNYTFLDKDITSYYVTESNVKICPEATFASSYTGILLGQHVNLHGNGAFSYEEVDISLSDWFYACALADFISNINEEIATRINRPVEVKKEN